MRLGAGEVCTGCISQDAWQKFERAGKLVIDREAIRSIEARKRGEEARRVLGVGSTVGSGLLAVAITVLCAHQIVLLFGPQKMALPGVIAAATRSSALRVALLGAVALAIGVVGLRLPSLRRGRLILRASWVLACVAGGAGLLGALFATLFLQPASDFAHLAMPPRGHYEALPPPVERALDAVVFVLAPDEDGDARSGALGSGVVVARAEKTALVVTCSHVAMPYLAVGAFRDAASARPVILQLADGREAPGKIVWTADPPLDVALIEAQIEGAPEPVPLSTETEGIESGEAVFFIPNPYRKGFLVERGKVIRREAHDTPAGRYSLLFTDLPVQPGDSGSGLFDARGRLIGLNTWTQYGPLGPQGISLPAEAMAEVARAMPRAPGTPGETATPAARSLRDFPRETLP